MNTQIQQIVKMFLNYPQLMQSWSATEFFFFRKNVSDSKPARRITMALSSSPSRTIPSIPFRSVIWSSRYWELPMRRKFWMQWRTLWRMERCGCRSILMQWFRSTGSLHRETSRFARPLPRWRVAPSLLTTEGGSVSRAQLPLLL